MKKPRIGNTIVKNGAKEVSGKYARLNGENFFVIENYDLMRPFFMTIVSATDHWLFASSQGGLAAGRGNPDNAIFPYHTDDKITSSIKHTGPKTILKVELEGEVYLWEPFIVEYSGFYSTRNNLYKNREGNKIIYEEINDDLGLTYRYGWMFSEKYGLIKKSYLVNNTDKNIAVKVLDGLQNILPYGVDIVMQNMRSTLTDAYKRCELDKANNLAIYSLSSMIVDKAEPSEALLCSTVWSSGLSIEKTLLSSQQIHGFKKSIELETEVEVKGEKGAYFIQSTLDLKAEGEKIWFIAADVSQSISEVVALKSEMKDMPRLHQDVLDDIANNKIELRKKIGLADGIQLTNDSLATGRHFSNVLFNIMRGGTFDDQYHIDREDFKRHVKRMNRKGYRRLQTMLNELPERVSYHQLRYFLTAAKHPEAMRYYYEYLPLSFSRRHGDPSRPWNYFSIESKDEKGNKILSFQGNWRDIFQNWEALAFSYPEFTLGMITKFVNASTIDGYNPYRITSDGVDWEVIDPHDPWSFIGYWGDHQVIYLTKLLEISRGYHPDRLTSFLTQKSFTFANVPYRIKGYDAISLNPKNTIDYDGRLSDEIRDLVDDMGTDGKLIMNPSGKLEKVNLTEKLLIMFLTKLYNFVPEAGIWLNTQRPEWNDANNALVGNGASMVTLNYMLRFIDVAIEMFDAIEQSSVEVNKPVSSLMEALQRGFYAHESELKKGFSDRSRRQFMDEFGVAGEHFRTTVYAGFTGEKKHIEIQKVLEFFALARKFLEHSIKVNKREDGLYHSYNLITLTEDETQIRYLYEMLEGQVAVLSSNYLKPAEAVEVLNSLRNSGMFRADQYSYMLYPDRELSGFMEKNHVDPSLLEGSKLFEILINHGDTSIIEKDGAGDLHFNGHFHNAKDLDLAMDQLRIPGAQAYIRREKSIFLSAFESVFDHKSFTGRSGSFFGYEGLGSIYWHMVSKLLMAVQENIKRASDSGADKRVIGKLIDHYYEIRAGIGVNKSPGVYGAFPTDAYSHTPKNSGVQQPGMTGQVKEDIINRWVELGIDVSNGRLSFNPLFLRLSEFLDEPANLSYYDHEGYRLELEVPEGGLAFTYCQTPITYLIADKDSMEVTYDDGHARTLTNLILTTADSKAIFQRLGKVKEVKVCLNKSRLC